MAVPANGGATRLKQAAREALLWAGRRPIGQRVLDLYERNGVLPGRAEPANGHEAAPPASIEELASRVDLLEDMWDRFRPRLPAPSYEDLAEDLDDDSVPPLDRKGVDPSTLSADQRHWWEHGYLVKERFVPDDLLDAYWKVRMELDDLGGWRTGAPYLEVPEVLDLSVYQPLTALLEELIGEPMAVNLNLTGIVSTERNWHQDDYLNYSGTKSWYAAVWFAVDDIDPDSGPFQYIPGSHRWPAVRRDRIKLFLPGDKRDGADWPKLTEQVLDPVLEREIERRGGEVRTFLGHKGDVLIWHGRLVHRGSLPAVPGTIRHSFIAHYTGINHWATGPNVDRHPGGGLYFLQ